MGDECAESTCLSWHYFAPLFDVWAPCSYSDYSGKWFHNSCAAHKLAIEKLFVVRRDTSSKRDKTRQSDLFVRAPLLSNADWLSLFFLQTPLNVSRFCLSECRILSNWRRCRGELASVRNSMHISCTCAMGGRIENCCFFLGKQIASLKFAADA